MKKTLFKLITTSLVCTAVFGFIGCSDMLSKFDSIQWGATYTVRHLLQDLNRDGNDVAAGRYTEDTYERETLINTVPNTLSEAKAKEIPGFTAQPFEQVIVNGDGSTTIDIKYNRNEVTLTFNPNGGYFVVEDGNTSKQSEEPIEITQLYGTTVSLPKPRFDSDESITVSLYNLVPVSGSTRLNASSDDMFIKFPVPPTSGTYRALWDFSTSIDNFSNALGKMPTSGGKVTLTGSGDDFSGISSALKKSDKTEIELDLAGLTINKENLTIGSDQNQGIINPSFDFVKNLTKVTLPKTGKIKLGYGAFSSCSNLELITIGSNVDVLHGGAFWGSTKLHFEVDSNHPSLVATSDGTALLRKKQDEAEKIEYSLVSYPSASGNINLGKLGFTITAIEEDALALLPDGNTTITFPATVKVIGPYADYQIDQGAHLTIIMEGTEPAELPGEVNTPACSTFGTEVHIYVPDGSVDTYKAASEWSKYAANIYPMSEYKPQ